MNSDTTAQLSATTVTITTPDPAPNTPTLVASASGSHVLAVWTDGGQIENGVRVPEAIWAVALSLDASGDDVGLPIQLASDGQCPVAATTADGFVVVWADATGLQLDHLDSTASTAATPSLLLDVGDAHACPSALLDSDAGLVVAWYEPGSTNEMLARIDAKGHVVSTLMIDQVPVTDSPDMALASLDGQTYLAHVRWSKDNPDSVISAIDWSKGAAADACGRVVALGNGGATPAGTSVGFFAEALAPAAPKVDLGSESEAALVAAGTQFAVLWYSRIGAPGGVGSGSSTLNFATLSWR